MSTPVVTITRDGPEDVPFAIPLGPQETYAPQSIYALFDGSGAAGDFLACCSIYSQDGSLIARCPTPAAVTAGDLAGVTFAPFLRQAAAAAVTALNLPWWYGQASLAADGTHAIFFSGATNDSATYSYDAGNDRVVLAQSGLYIVGGYAEWATGGATPITDRFGIFLQESTGQNAAFLWRAQAPGNLGTVGATKLWDVFELDLFNLIPSSGNVYMIGATSGASTALGAGATLFIVRISDAIPDLFAGP